MRWERAEDIDELARILALFNDLNNEAMLHAVQDMLFDFPYTRLAAYGTLRPGESNHALLSEVAGTWLDGTVHGARFVAHGYPAFKWRQGDDQVPVSVLRSDVLPAHWPRLDEFEGPSYRRIPVPVRLPNATNLVACLYEYLG
jgi:gamma-glutamylcyclotransferase (GGCT)/AIG2-like uncharacterized protein YtfP